MLALYVSPVLALVACRSVHAQESWDAIYLTGSKIGWVHTFVEKVRDRGRDFLRVRIDMEQRLKRGDDVAVTKLMYGTIETLDGQVLKLDTRTLTGDNDIRVHGDVVRGKMTLIMDGAPSGGGRQEEVITWGPEVRGPYAPEQSMARKLMKENEKRQLKMFMPGLNKICEVQLQSGQIQPVILGDGKERPLLRVEQKTFLAGKAVPENDATLWVDAEGQVLKTEQDIFGGVVMYRTTEDAAKSPGGPLQLDLNKSTNIKVLREIPNADRTRYVKYRIKLKDSKPEDALPSDPRQTIQGESNQSSAILEIRSMGPLDGEPGPAEVDDQYLKPNGLVNSQDRQVVSLAHRATRGVVDPWEKAVRINRWVHQNLDRKNFQIAFATASEVARNLTGDCTEHSVLAAAMCRAVGIPARVAIGLLYVDDPKQGLKGFGYHMWDEVYINRRWVALDPTLDQSSVDAAHIKLTHSSLQGVSPFEAFLPIVRVAGKLEIEPIELR
jgi:transglutaminase-like putative cysteine protease